MGDLQFAGGVVALGLAADGAGSAGRVLALKRVAEDPEVDQEKEAVLVDATNPVGQVRAARRQVGVDLDQQGLDLAADGVGSRRDGPLDEVLRQDEGDVADQRAL